jgi:RHS repeat-associated protein
MVAVMVVQFALFPPEVSHAAVKAVSATANNSAQNAHLWWHASGWAAWSERFLRENFPKFGASVQQRNWDGKGAPRRAMPKPEPQETQEERNSRVARVEISPREATIAAGLEIYFIAVAYDANNSPIGGVSFDWDKENEDTGERVSVEERGKFSAANGRFSSAKEGNYRVKARFGGFDASAKVKVKGLKYLSGQQPIGTRTVSSRDLPQPSRSSLAPPATKDRIAKKATGRFMTRYSSGGTRAMPRLLPLILDEFGWNDGNYLTADDPGKERGEPLGHTPDGGAGSSNFQFAAPVLSLDGRGQDLNFGLSYNSRVWHKANTEITFDIDHDWPAPGWSTGFGKIVGMGGQSGYMIIEPDGTRRPYICSLTIYTGHQEAVCKTTDGSFIDYKVTGDTPANGGAPQFADVYLPNGTQAYYPYPANNAVYMSGSTDRNGNVIGVSYRGLGPQIDKITDTLGRVIQFYYDSNNLPVAITGPGLNGSTRTLARIAYDWKDLSNLGGSYGFSGVTPKVRNNVIPVIKAIYYPANKTGYWFGDTDSYSAYGMLAKVIEQRAMDFSAAPLPVDPNQSADPGTITSGLMTRQMVYDYPLTASGLSQEPSYQNTTETWAFMDGDPAVTHYSVQENASPRRVEITRPDGVKTVMLSHNAPGQWNDGLIYQDETHNPQDALLGKSFVQWEQGECPPAGQAAGPYQYCAPRPSRVETTDERGQRTGKELSYGTRFNQVIETREYGYGYVFGGANTLLRRTVNQYLNDPNYTDPQPALNLVWHHIFNLLTLTDVYDGNGVRLSRTEYSYDQFKGTAGLMDAPGIVIGSYDYSGSPYYGNPNYDLYNLDTRGNITTIKRYADAASLDEGSAVVETRHYDITGNVRKMETSCCEQTTVNYTLNTQYAWPESQVSGSPSDTNKQNTSSAIYDFNTGLVNSSTNANGRISQTTYDPNTLRPVAEYSPTLSYNYHIYDDVAMTVKDFAYEAGLSGANFASRVDKSLDGHGRVIKEIAFGKADAQDIVDIKYDQLERVSQQSRPYRAGATPLWTTVTYDFLDRPVQTTAPDNSVVTRSYNQPDPPGSSGQPGETIKLTDPWGRERWARSDALGRTVEVAEPDPGGNGTLSSGAMFTTYAYDAHDRLVQVNQGAQTRSFRYDSLGRLTHQKLAERDAKLNPSGDWVESGQWSDVFTYDNRSNLTQHVDARGVKTIFKYKDAEGVEDPLNRLLRVEYDKSGSPANLSVNIPVAPNVSYAYVTAGDKRRVQNVTVDQGMGNETMSYDSEGRLSQVVQTFTGRESYPLKTDYIWDSLDRLKENTYPKQYIAGEIRKIVEPTYDAASRIDSLKFGGATYASAPVYNAASQMTSLAVGSQITEKYDFDPKTGLLFGQQVNKGAEKLVDLQYRYTLDVDWNNNGAKTGQLTYVRDVKNEARNRNYVYDKLGRLKQVRGGTLAYGAPAWYQTYSYDRYGNRSLVQLTALGTAPAKPGSQSRSDLIGEIGSGANGNADWIIAAQKPFAALGINDSYGPTATGFSDNDNTGTLVRGGPRVTAEEYGNAPSANGVGGKLLAEHHASAAPSAQQKKYGNRRGLSIVTPQSGSVVTVYPGAYQTPDPGQGGRPVGPISITGHNSTSSSFAPASGGFGSASASDAGSARWSAFQSVSGGILSIRLKFNWSVSGIASASAGSGGSAQSSCSFNIGYSLNGGSSWINGVSRSIWDSQNLSDSGSEDILLSVGQNITQVQVRDFMSTSASASGGELDGSSAQADITVSISDIRLEVSATPVISNVAAGGITATGATITWTTNDNSDSQVEYGLTTAYGQSTPLNSTLVTAHSQALSGLTAGTLYHYRVKSRDAAGNLAISGDFTFTTAPPPDTTPPVISIIAAGEHQHFFYNATQTLQVNAGDRLYAYVYLDPANVPQEVMLQWNDGTWEHRAYWGANDIPWGTDGTESRLYMGPLPAAGGWVRLEVPASSLGLEGKTLNGIAFTLYGGRANWDNAGKTNGAVDTAWVDDALPAGAIMGSDGGDIWTWLGSSPSPYSGTVSSQSNITEAGITTTGATITWITNENSDSQVEYGLTTAYEQSTPLNSTLVTAHSQALSGLTAGTLYHYRVKSRDAAGNLAISGDFTFTSGSVVTSNVAAGGITASSATITWNTNYNSDSQVEYGLTTTYGQSAPTTPNPTLVIGHSQVLSGLTAGTVYHYRVKSRDAAGNLGVSGDFTFTTGSLVTTNVAAGGITASSATITWNTNENSDSQVEYGVDTGYGLSAPTTPNPALVTTHSQGLSGLTAGTVYHYRVRSRDAVGNLAVSGDFTFTTTQSGSIPLDGLASLSYNDANNRINTSGFEYDPAGYQTRAVINASGTQQQYRYDCAGRLAQVLDGSGNVLATYSYGAGNQRLMSVEGGVTKYFAWARGNIVAEYEAWGANALIWKKSYVYLEGRLLATTSGADGTETRFHHYDRLGTRLVTDAGGTVVTEQLGMPFGTMLPFTQTYGGENSYQHPTLSNPSKKRFTSYDRSDVTGLHYAVNRSYSSEQGRFTQVDPIEMDAVNLENPQTLNMYAYCGNDPINHVDPKGLFFGKLFRWIGKILKWVAVAAVVAVAVIAHVMPATWIVSLAQWASNHAILSAILGINTPNFAILHLAAIGTEGAVIGLGAGAYLSAAVGAVANFAASFTNNPPHRGGKTEARQRKAERRGLKELRQRTRVQIDGEDVEPRVPKNPRAHTTEPNNSPGQPGEEFGKNIYQRKPPPSDAHWKVRWKYRIGLAFDWVGNWFGGGGGLTVEPLIFINPQIYCEADPSLPWCPRRTMMF